MSRFCKCETPRDSVDPRRAGWCARCLRRLNPEWLSTDKTVREFFDSLQRALPSHDSEWQAFRQMCETRERVGRKEYGLEYFKRNNLNEAMEEASDLALYPFLDSLVAIKDGRAGEDYDLVLEIAFHAFQAYRKILRLQHKRHHCP